MQITKHHLAFVQEAKEAFESHSLLETYRNDGETLIALRMGEDRDCVNVYELGNEIANFVQQMEPCPKPRRVISEFAYDMEKQLQVNDHKGGWKREHWCDLATDIEINIEKLRKELMKKGRANFDLHEITIRCANIANYAMMIADNEGEHL